MLLGEMKAAIAKSHPVEMDFLPHENNPEQLHRLQCESNKAIKSEPKSDTLHFPVCSGTSKINTWPQPAWGCLSLWQKKKYLSMCRI